MMTARVTDGLDGRGQPCDVLVLCVTHEQLTSLREGKSIHTERLAFLSMPIAVLLIAAPTYEAGAQRIADGMGAPTALTKSHLDGSEEPIGLFTPDEE